ncbi:hypothetical protein PQX77_016530 [Marasmius sp. AFHP31]|nr:hypothetical protein PQX77_016530 [Marasmius sp. AFHP31]
MTHQTPPPAYTDLTSSHVQLEQVLELPKAACNYTRLVRETGSIQETFVVDHSIRITEALLPPLIDAPRGEEGTNNNLYVKTKRGDVDVNIHVAEDDPATLHSGSSSGSQAIVCLVVESDNGDVVVRLNAPPREKRCAVNLIVGAQSGSIFVLLPRSIAGIVDITADSQPVVVSRELSNTTNTIDEHGRARKLFIGELKGPWNPRRQDKLALTASKRVFLQYLDEVFEKPKVEGGPDMKSKDPPPPIYTADPTKGDDLQKTPCNYTRLIRENGPINETFVVDHTIRVNEALLSPLTDTQRQAEGGRNNLYVKAKCGDVDVNIHVVEDNPASSSNTPLDLTKSLPSKLKLVAESENGDVVHAPGPRERRRPVHLTVKARSGSVFVLLPRSTRAVVKVTADRRPIEISDQLSQITNTISEESKERKLIIGEVKGPWLNTDEKDELFLEASRRVFLQYVDEGKFEKPKMTAGLPRRLPFLHRKFKKSSIKEKVVLDPFLPVSEDLADSAVRFFDLCEKPWRKLEIVYLWTGKGNIDLDMQVDEGWRTGVTTHADVMPSVSISSDKGDVSLTLHDSPTVSRPIDFEINATDGDVFLYIPRGIGAMIDIRASRTVTFSSALSSTIESPVESDKEKKYYLGQWETKRDFVFMIHAQKGTVFLQYEKEKVNSWKIVAARLSRLSRSLPWCR